MSAARSFRSYLTLPLLVSSLLLTAAGCTDDTDDLSLKHQDTVTVKLTSQPLYPEGVQFDTQNNCFVVGSETLGTIGQVRDDGSYTAFINDVSLVSSIGINVDGQRDRLLVAVSDPGYNTARTKTSTLGKLARVVVFNSNTGVRTKVISLDTLFRPGKPHFANDIALDASGNAYVTDSYSPIIYQINSQNTPSPFKQDTLFAPSAAGTIGLNGITYSAKGYLLAVKSDTGTLLKIPISNGAGGTVSKVTTDLDLTGGDGIKLQDDSTLLVVLNKQNKVVQLRTKNAWASSRLVGTFTTPDVYPTSLAQRTIYEPYVLYSHLNALQGNQAPVTEFIIQKVKF